MVSTARKSSGSSLVDKAYRAIKQRILDNSFPPGHQALEQEVAADLDMSRTPVREALIRLEKEGLVELVPRRGMRVVPLSPADVKDIYEVLTCLEAMAADLLARRGVEPKELEPMERAVRQMDRSLEADDLEAWAAADEEFHRTLLELCGNRRLADMAFAVWEQVHRARFVTLRLRPKPWQSNSDHRAVLDAVRRGDWREARELHDRHRRRAGEEITGILEQYRLTAL
jgi:DNA-binding GntR family transcriptional regulator